MVDIKKSFAETLSRPDMMGEKRFEEQEIKDIPILVTEDNTFVCIKRRDEVSAIAIVGMSGGGKSVCLQNVVEGLFYIWYENVALMNDYSSETLAWSQPSEIRKFIKMNSYLNLKPTPLPLVYVFPNTCTLDLEEKYGNLLNNKNYVKVSLPVKEVLNNLAFYFNAICPEFKLGQSTMYADSMVEEFENCEVPEDFYDVIDNRIENIKAFRGMKEKIKTAFRKIFAEQILRVTSPDAPCFLKVEDFIAEPMSTILYSNCIPSLVVSDLKNKKYQNAILAYHINYIFENQRKKEFKDKKVYLVFDEMASICTTADKESNPAKDAIINLVARGRINNVGIIYATQYYNKIPHEIKSAKMNYLITFKTDNKIAKEIASDFTLPDEYIKKMTKLDVLQCLAVTTDKFVCYKDGKRWESDKPFIGKIIPPCSQHQWV